VQLDLPSVILYEAWVSGHASLHGCTSLGILLKSIRHFMAHLARRHDHAHSPFGVDPETASRSSPPGRSQSRRLASKSGRACLVDRLPASTALPVLNGRGHTGNTQAIGGRRRAEPPSLQTLSFAVPHSSEQLACACASGSATSSAIVRLNAIATEAPVVVTEMCARRPSGDSDDFGGVNRHFVALSHGDRGAPRPCVTLPAATRRERLPHAWPRTGRCFCWPSLEQRR
jgi:hypothetical protein